MANKVAVIVPNWNGQHHLEQCLSTLLGQTYPEFEIVVIDNGSTDGSVAMMRERFPQVRVITNAENVGFARANNQGILATDTPFVATLNNDTRSESTWLEEMIRAMEMSVEVGMVAAKVLYMDPPHLIDSAGIEVDRVGYAWNRHNGRPDSHQEREPYGVFGPSAAAALYRRHMLDDVGLFDESYFAYYEDTDLAWRAQLMGWRCLYAPAARVYHVHSATSRRQGSPFKRYFLVRNKTWTTFKNYPAPTVWLNLPVILLYDMIADVYRMVAERNVSPIRGRLAALIRLPAVLNQRRIIQRQRRVPWQTLRERMIPPPNLAKSLWNLRKAKSNSTS